MNKLKSFRGICFLSSMLILFFLTFQFYIQANALPQSCPMIYNERLILLTLGFLFLTSSLFQHNLSSQRYSSWICFIVSLVGLIISGKHAWIQFSGAGSLPEFTTAQLQSLPYSSILKLGLTGTSSCTDAIWVGFGLSLVTWMFIVFLLFTIVSLWQSTRKFYRK